MYALCTIAERPRLPEHCIEYISIVEWKKNFDRPIDTDSVDDINWVCENAQKRGEQYGIFGINYSLTLGVIKNVIPAIASTNAIIAAETVLEAIKVLTNVSSILDNNFMYMGHEGLYGSHEKYEKEPDCNICSKPLLEVVSEKMLLRELIDLIIKKYGLESPSLNRGFHFIYFPNNDEMHQRLDKTLGDLLLEKILPDSGVIELFDNNIKDYLILRLTLEK